jgi:hypothetical protein
MSRNSSNERSFDAISSETEEFRKTVASALPSQSVETYPSKGDRFDTRTSETLQYSTLQPPLWRQPRAVLNERKQFPSIWVVENNPRLLQLRLETSGSHPSAVGAGFEQARQQKEGSTVKRLKMAIGYDVVLAASPGGPRTCMALSQLKRNFTWQCKNKKSDTAK